MGTNALMPFGKYKGHSQVLVAQFHPHYYLTLCRKNQWFVEEVRDPKAVDIARVAARRYLDDDDDWGIGGTDDGGW